MPMAYPDSNFHSQNAKAFARCVAEGTGGELEIVTHAGGSLFKGNEIKRAVQTGQAPIGERLLSAHQNEEAVFGFDSVPFLASSYEASDKLWEAARPTIEQTLDEQNLVLLYAVPWPPQGLYTKKPLEAASDLQGVKFRSYNAATARMAELMGAVPVQIEEAELSQALATGVADSFISSGSTGYDRKVWEHMTHWYDVAAWLPRNMVFVNKDAWEGLDEATPAGAPGLRRPGRRGRHGRVGAAERLVQGAARRERHDDRATGRSAARRSRADRRDHDRRVARSDRRSRQADHRRVQGDVSQAGWSRRPAPARRCRPGAIAASRDRLEAAAVAGSTSAICAAASPRCS